MKPPRGLDKLFRLDPGAFPARLRDLLGQVTGGPGLAQSAPTDSRFRAGQFANAAGSRPYRLFVPARVLHAPPLLVMLHGCTQSPEDFATGTRMNALADTHGFLVLYPGQPSSANANGCWNWFRGADQRRGHGEPSIIADMARDIATRNGVDGKRVFAAGLSAGGAMAATLGALYPDVFAAIGVHSGLAHGAATDMTGAFAAMRQGRPGIGRIAVPVIIFHGDHDRTVDARNGDAVAAQAMPAQGAARRLIEGETAGRRFACTRFTGADGRPDVEHWVVAGAGHAWSGGDPAGSFTDASGPDASGEMLRFFLGR